MLSPKKSMTHCGREPLLGSNGKGPLALFRTPVQSRAERGRARLGARPLAP